ncbi:MAG: Crp/Fnr family transcriptional regulator [Cyclobacteriaceae bacterium]|nr:Crp/Fnr family transcriptional regulator [Cyclobacteriaceae bacterium]
MSVEQTSDNFWFLHNIDLYAILCPPKLKGYLKDHSLCYKKDDVIYYQLDKDQKIYLVSKGTVRLVKYDNEGNEIVIIILKKGEIFGEKALLGIEERQEYALANSNDTMLCPLSTEAMYTLMRDNQQFELYIRKLIGLRLKKFERRLEILFHKDIKTRLVEFIRELIEEDAGQGKKIEGTYSISHIFTHGEIANLIGTTRATVTRILNLYKEDGLLDYNRNSITIYNTKDFLKN